MIASNVRNLILQPDFDISAFRAGSEDAYFLLKGEVERRCKLSNFNYLHGLCL